VPWGVTSELGTTPATPSPTQIAAPGTKQGIAAFEGMSAMLGMDGLLYMGGSNNLGQMGDGTFAQHPDFVLAVSPSLDGYLNLSGADDGKCSGCVASSVFVSSVGGNHT